MNIKKLKEIIKDLPDEMPVILLDETTSDVDYMNYQLADDSFQVDEYYKLDSEDHENGIPAGLALFITFENHLNEDPV